jgi:hypothetical protein
MNVDGEIEGNTMIPKPLRPRSGDEEAVRGARFKEED